MVHIECKDKEEKACSAGITFGIYGPKKEIEEAVSKFRKEAIKIGAVNLMFPIMVKEIEL